MPIRLSPVENLLCEVYDRFDGEGMGAMVLKVRGRVEAEPTAWHGRPHSARIVLPPLAAVFLRPGAS